MSIDQHKMKNTMPVQNSLAPIPNHSAHKSKHTQVSVTISLLASSTGVRGLERGFMFVFQHHRMAEVERHLWSLSTPLSTEKSLPARWITPSFVLNISMNEIETTQFLWASLPVFDYPQRKKFIT